MPYPSKIATCCYCGSRTALVLKGQARHELACANCGAPLHEMKMLRTDAKGDREVVKPSPIRGKPRKSKKHRASKKKKRRSMSDFVFYKMREAAEDVFDDVFDIFD
ncbi:MAG: hypothetical protein QNJ35_12065 [Paracoccaceae bacterium]|nr:hypothetical protein [Paracoccaceae bacterium]